MVDWKNYDYKQYITPDEMMFKLPKGVSISTMCAKCKLGTELNIDLINSF